MNKFPPYRNTKQKGMALLEILVAMLLFALAILPLVRLQVMSMDATKAGYLKTETAAVAQSILDYFITEKKDLFNGSWTKIVVKAGDDCDSLSGNTEKNICQILNGQFLNKDSEASNIHNEDNAILCIYKENPPSRSDQRLISIRTVWYIGKRQDGDDYYNKELTESDCGSGYGSKMESPTLSKQNIDYLEINMAY